MQEIPRAAVLATAIVCLVALGVTAPAAAGEIVRPKLSAEVVGLLGERPVAGLPLAPTPDGPPPFDGALFGQELLAFALKEAFADSEDEYEGSSGIRGPLDPRPIDVRHRFGDHCLWTAHRLWLTVRGALPFGTTHRVAVPEAASRNASTLVAGSVVAHGLWTALRNEIVDRRNGMALRPKISTRKIALELKFRW